MRKRGERNFETFMGGESGVQPSAAGGADDADSWVSKDTSVEKPEVPQLDRMLEGKPIEKEPFLPQPYVRIVRSVFRIDEEKIFDRATTRLAFHRKAHLVEYGEIVDALDEASQISMEVSQLQQNVKVVAKLYRADVETLRSDLRAKAVAALQAEKPEKGGKTITDADVTARMAGSFPDEYRRQEEMLAKIDGTVAFVSQLVEDWAARRRELEGMMRTSRKVM